MNVVQGLPFPVRAVYFLAGAMQCERHRSAHERILFVISWLWTPMPQSLRCHPCTTSSFKHVQM